jgi:hypothetical protein
VARKLSLLGSLEAPQALGEHSYTLFCHSTFALEALLINALFMGTPETWGFWKTEEWNAKP